MKGGHKEKPTVSQLVKLTNMTQTEIKRVIRCCYKSKVVSDKIINYLENNQFSKESVDIVMVKLKSNERYHLAIDPTVMASYASPIEDEDEDEDE